ncbi:gluconate 5-dehydrogenase [Streptomyces sulfonofaciens]|uniref:Gluconate 5-dehydrogenase n=1 Tax=Streptomyces sulfonofaciens TaxID=68272 RepID=A0A919GLJ1_9ACTN|nr:glucose 1-dehydrogenase [Streptomyces sulfonofaciens]GHH86738.1 gluconate 5-dehydrogenase [Streptomyces sulfonofaciens]
MAIDLTGRTAIVTGAASGIGRSVAVRLAAAGASVVIADRTPLPWHGGPSTEHLVTAAGGTAEFMACDLAVTSSVEAMFARAEARWGHVDIVVNNAAVSTGTSLTDTDDADWNHVLAVNVTGVFTLCRAAVRHMLDRPPRGEVRGRIVNITSQHGMVAAPEDIAYGVSKAAVAQLTRQIAVEYAAQGIVCNAVAPGKIETGPSARAEDPRWHEYWTSRTPWPRLGRPEDVAGAVLFLASDEASYITGVNLMVDGGWMAG